jgi:hypothetical protein
MRFPEDLGGINASSLGETASESEAPKVSTIKDMINSLGVSKK